jgi:2-C-methyl-D-erythritol 4-phosphate cytidylyltransferase
MKVIAIIPAAGLGTRMSFAPGTKIKKGAPSKQFTELGGTPILLHTLRKFAASPEVSEIIVGFVFSWKKKAPTSRRKKCN